MQDQQESGENLLAQSQSAQVPPIAAAPSRPAVRAARPDVHHSANTAAQSNQERKGKKLFADVVPYPEPIVPALLLNAIFQLLLRFMIMSVDQARAATLWIAMTWFIDVVKVAPLALITAPGRECGKSILLEIFSRLVRRGLTVANSSAAFLFRVIESLMPTLLIDEADMFVRENFELKGLINAGHTRASATVGRVEKVGDQQEFQLFNVWSAKALAGIDLQKHLQDATVSRGIPFAMRRRRPDEFVERLRHADPAEFEMLQSQLARFAADYAEQVSLARPDMPKELSDREQDNWEALFAIAECAGLEWVEYARTAALALSRKHNETADDGTKLLTDIRVVFDRKWVSRISSSDLLSALIYDDPEAPWATHNFGKPLTATQLNQLLAPYGIHSKTVRFGAATPKGFELSQFEDAFARYLPRVNSETVVEQPAPLPQQPELVQDDKIEPVDGTDFVF